MTREEAKRILYVYRAVNLVDASHREAFDMAIEALEQEPCTDAISRQAVIDALTNTADIAVKCGTVDKEENKRYLPELIRWIKGFPPVNTTEKVGRWTRVSMDKYVQHAMAYYRCSECGKDIIGTHNYCPNCGAKMGGTQHDD